MGGSHIVITPVPSAGMREVRVFLLASVWSALCYQRGQLLLHASVIQVGGSAVAFCGGSGVGKSSTAAWLLQRGYAPVSDDLCLCRLSPDKPPAVWASTTRLKLWNESLQALGWDFKALERAYQGADKFHLPCQDLSPSLHHPLPLRAIYHLQWGELSVTRLKGSQALRCVVENATYRGDLLDAMTQAGPHWTQCAQLVSQVPVWEFSRPRNWERMEAALQMLREHWPASQGITA